MSYANLKMLVLSLTIPEPLDEPSCLDQLSLDFLKPRKVDKVRIVHYPGD